MIPRIAKTSDRLPFPPNTSVVYWNILSPTEAVKTDYRGITKILSEDEAANMVDMGGIHAAAANEEVIVLLDQHGTPSNVYERIHHIDPMEDEPQRWWPEGVDPNKAHVDQS